MTAGSSWKSDIRWDGPKASNVTSATITAANAARETTASNLLALLDGRFFSFPSVFSSWSLAVSWIADKQWSVACVVPTGKMKRLVEILVNWLTLYWMPANGGRVLAL